MARVFLEGLEAHSSLPPSTDWAGVQKSSLPWYRLQGPPQDSLLLTFALDSILLLALTPAHPAPVSLRSLLSALLPPFAFVPVPSHCPAGRRCLIPPLSPPEVGAPSPFAKLSEGRWL